MSEPLVLVILLGTSPDPTTDGLMAAARGALGPEAVVLVETSPVTTDTEALAIGARVRARAVARVSWADRPSQRTARLHVHVAPSGEWADDELTFLPNDVPSEKGRTVGYALATMVQRLEREQAREKGPTVAGEPGAPSTPATASPPVAPLVTPDGRDTKVEPPREPPSSPGLARDFDVLAYGTGALGGGATSAGGAGGVRWWPVPRFGVRAAVGARAGSIAEADATTTTLFAAAGPGYRVPIGRSFELGARADFVVLQHSVARRRPVETTRARALAAIDLMIEAGWWLGPHAGLVAGVGAELAFGTTPVSIGGTPVADIPPARGLAELGVRFRF
ncbi:MAG: hypothetical protein KF764_28040 [Labilithrix sp.]|nr:hypothetical protein [Labilithrix sp.]